MASRPEATRPVDAHGSLRVDTPAGQSLDLVADGETLRLELPGWSDVLTVLPNSFRGRTGAARAFADLLAIHGLTLILEAGGRPVVRLGHNVRPSWLARLLGIGANDLRFSNLRLLIRN